MRTGRDFASEDGYRQVKSRLELRVADLGPQNLKNITEPVRAYLLRQGAPAAVKVSKRTTNKRRPVFALAATLAVAIVGAGAYAWHTRLTSHLVGVSVGEDKLADAAHLSIVVLPFTNLSGDLAQNYFGDGIPENLNDRAHFTVRNQRCTPIPFPKGSI
jgi:hypothetical protein